MKQENKITSNFLLIYDNKPLVLNSTEKTIKDIKNSLLSLYNLSSYDYILYFDEDCENIIKNDELKLTNISKIYMEKIDTNNLELNKIYNFLRKKDELLGSKKERETEDFNIKYYVNDNKIEKKFVPDIDELYNFFNDKNTQVVISKVDDSKISKEENSKNNMIPFDYDEFKKAVTKIRDCDIFSKGGSDSSLSSLIVDLPVSDGIGITDGYAYIDSQSYVIKVKIS